MKNQWQQMYNVYISAFDDIFPIDTAYGSTHVVNKSLIISWLDPGNININDANVYKIIFFNLFTRAEKIFQCKFTHYFKLYFINEREDSFKLTIKKDYAHLLEPYLILHSLSVHFAIQIDLPSQQLLHTKSINIIETNEETPLISADEDNILKANNENLINNNIKNEDNNIQVNEEREVLDSDGDTSSEVDEYNNISQNHCTFKPPPPLSDSSMSGLNHKFQRATLLSTISHNNDLDMLSSNSGVSGLNRKFHNISLKRVNSQDDQSNMIKRKYIEKQPFIQFKNLLNFLLSDIQIGEITSQTLETLESIKYQLNQNNILIEMRNIDEIDKNYLIKLFKKILSFKDVDEIQQFVNHINGYLSQFKEEDI